MKDMKLPKMSTVKPPRYKSIAASGGSCHNLLAQRFDQKVSNMVWGCDFTHVKVDRGFHYVCAILDLYFRQVIASRALNYINKKEDLDWH
jgi:transposase InsO family protein